MNLAIAILATMLRLQEPGQSMYSLVEVPAGSPPACPDRTSFLCRPPRYVSPEHMPLDPARPGGVWVRPETRAEGLARYWLIAREAELAVCGGDPMCTAAPNDDQLELAAEVIATVFQESGFRRDVHAGKGPHARGDGGRSWGLGQVMAGTRPESRVPWFDGGVEAGSLVGLTPAATARALAAVAVGLRHNPRCTDVRCRFVTYMGGAHEVLLARRMATYHRVLEALPTAQIGTEDAIALGLAEGNCQTCEDP